MMTDYIIDDFQQTYFVIDSFDQLLEDCYKDFSALYDRLEDRPIIQPHETRQGDRLFSRGTLDYFRNKGTA